MGLLWSWLISVCGLCWCLCMPQTVAAKLLKIISHCVCFLYTSSLFSRVDSVQRLYQADKLQPPWISTCSQFTCKQCPSGTKGAVQMEVISSSESRAGEGNGLVPDRWVTIYLAVDDNGKTWAFGLRMLNWEIISSCLDFRGVWHGGLYNTFKYCFMCIGI